MGLVLFYLSSGLFLGWSLGANDAANVFGTAVGSRMVRFTTAALICSVFVTLGAVVSGAGAAHTLGKLGAIDTLAGAFVVALASAITVFAMTHLGIPVSTGQAIVGSIVGWNLFSGNPVDMKVFSKIASTWVICPVLSLVFAAGLFLATKAYLDNARIHLIRLDALTRLGLILAGAFGSYSLGANNIANVMGVFVKASPFPELVLGNYHFTPAQQLFLLGGLAISVGVYTYSQRVMKTVGKGLYDLSPVAALVVVISSSLVLFLFASRGLHDLLVSRGLPAFPLVPVSSSQAVVGSVIGIGLAKGGRNVNYRSLGRISLGWVLTPAIAALISFVALFFMQNVFQQAVHL